MHNKSHFSFSFLIFIDIFIFIFIFISEFSLQLFTTMKKYIVYLLPVLLVLTGWQFRQPHAKDIAPLAAISIPNYEKTITEKGMLKFESEDALLYIKPAVKAFQGSHDPRICWQGSGYEFTKIKKITVDEIQLYTALLTKGRDTLHTAWWFDNGELKTINEWEWRWTTLSGKSGFKLVNVTTDKEEDLPKIIKEILATNL